MNRSNCLQDIDRLGKHEPQILILSHGGAGPALRILNEYRRWPIRTFVTPFNLSSAQEKHEVKKLGPHFFIRAPPTKLLTRGHCVLY